jgi:hypothetical protein
MVVKTKYSLATEHLELLYGPAEPEDGLITIYAKEPYIVKFFSPTALAEAAEFARSVSQESDVFHVVNLISPSATADIESRSGRGRESEIQSLVALVCEIDTNRGQHKRSDYPSQAVALEALERMPLKPSMVNLSGPPDGGLHVYWALRNPAAVADETTRETAKSISRQWQERLRSLLGSYRLDSTFDLVRVLRVPGCRNHKYANVVTSPLLVSEKRYGLEDFARYCKPLQRPSRPDLITVDTVANSERTARCRAYLSRVPDAVSGQHGHDKTFRAACECFRFGLSRFDARKVLAWFNETKTPPDDKWSEEELEHKLQSAMETVHRHGEFGVRLG